MQRFIVPKAMTSLLVLVLVSSLVGGCSSTPSTLTVLTYDGFQLPADLQTAFERDHNTKIQILREVSADALLQQLATGAAGQADVVYGINTFTLERARAARLAQPYAAKESGQIAPGLPGDADGAWWPVDVDYISLACDAAFFKSRGWTPPDNLRALTDPQLQHKFVLPNPETSSIGFAFLALSVAEMPEDGPYPWPQFWKDMAVNILHTVPSWNEGYSTQFSGILPDGNPGEGLHPMIPAPMASAYADFSIKARQSPRVVTWPGPSLEVIRYAGIRQGAANRETAAAFVDLLLSEPYQRSLAANAYTYPVREGVQLLAAFNAHAPRPTKPVRIPPADIERGRERWLKIWRKMAFGEG